ncbi:uncharacterized protein LOC121417887 [Lytechinus variegatus]|uniref:uncharacterized protein LOC121417887 n=1 Tax=Lytechinus variegatus TaxID=7654 RepID=UPI001BB23A89|nr:uncharacterized protein LOC121417887 [Lytechinus variegatus]
MTLGIKRLKMAATQFRSIVDEILNMLSSYTSMNNTDANECYLCMDKISESDTYVTCESCSNHFHVTCEGYLYNEKLADQRLIWICPCCAHSNFGDRIFDQVCIPSHYNRYEPLMLADGDDDTDENMETLKKSRRVRRAKKRFNKVKKSAVFAEQCSRRENGFTNNLCHLVDQNLVSEEIDGNWIKVQCKKTKLMAKKTERTTHSNLDEQNEQGKRKKRSGNGVLLEPGVTYIGKAFKRFYGSCERKIKEQKKEYEVDKKMENKEKDINVQSYVETLLNIYTCTVKSPLSMKFYNEANEVIDTMKNQSYARVTSCLSALSKASLTKHLNPKTCIVVEKMQNLRRYRVYAGGRKGRNQRRNMKGQFTKVNQSDDNCSDVSKIPKKEVRTESNKDMIENNVNCKEDPVAHQVNSFGKSMTAGKVEEELTNRNVDQYLHINSNESACVTDEVCKHMSSKETMNIPDRVSQVEPQNDLEENESGSDIDIDTPIKRNRGRNCIESDSDTSVEDDVLLISSFESERSCQYIDTQHVRDETCRIEIVPDAGLNKNTDNAILNAGDECTDDCFAQNSLECGMKAAIVQKIKEDNMHPSSNESRDEVVFVSDLGMCDRPDKYFKFLPLETTDKQAICKKLNITYTDKSFHAKWNSNECIGIPSCIKIIAEDGNCFFRAISYAISGTECHHVILRNLTVNHLLQTNDKFKSTLTSEFRTVREYVLKNGIMENGTWATDTEMSALANLIDTDIYSYNDEVPCWQLYSARKPGRINVVTSPKGIYIQYTRNVHFHVVESVTSVSSDSSKNIAAMEDIIETVNMHIQPVTQGTFHQGDMRFGDSAGKQCVANSLSALLYSKMKNAKYWNSNDLDRILVNGNELYSYIRYYVAREQEYLLISDLPECLEAYDELFEIECRESIPGLLEENPILEESVSMPLKQALEQELCSNCDACFVTFSGNAFIVICGYDSFLIFDSHSRSSKGLIIDDGYSILLQASSWQGVYEHCMRLARTLKCSPYTEYEVTSICVKAISCRNETLQNHLELQGCASVVCSNANDESDVVIPECSLGYESLKKSKSKKLNHSLTEEEIIDDENMNVTQESNEEIDYNVDNNQSKYVHQPKDSENRNGWQNVFKEVDLKNGTQNTSCMLSKKRKLSNLQSDVKVVDDGYEKSHKCKVPKKSDIELLSIAESDFDENDIEITAQVHSQFWFKPLVDKIKLDCCKKINIANVVTVCSIANFVHKECVPLEQPKDIKNIKNDGNCFYRAISYSLTGNENYHLSIRQAVCTHLMQNQDRFVGCIRSGYTNIFQYASDKNIQENGIWATEVEIFVLANLIEMDIYIYNDDSLKWSLFSGKNVQIGKETSVGGIYLKNSNGNHYDVVLSVLLSDFSNCMCSNSYDENIAKTYTVNCEHEQERKHALLNNNKVVYSSRKKRNDKLF